MTMESSALDQPLDHWIGGRSVAPACGQYRDDLNPLDDTCYARVADGTDEDIQAAVQAAEEAFGSYRQSLPKERERWLLRAAELLEARSDEFVEILIDEIGSPIRKAEREIATAVGTLRGAAGATRRLTGKTIPSDVPGRMSFSVRQPLGVIAGITPFNVPLIKGIKQSAMPLATGNTFVLLPSEEAPVIAYRIAGLLSEAGFPDGVFNVVTGSGYKIGDALTTHPSVAMVTFTGSTRVGRHIAENCAREGKRCTLEMGGKNPLVVLADADLEKAVMASVIGSFLYQGQICMSSSRIYVEQSLYDEFLKRFVAAASRLGMGDLRDASTMVGPIINQRQRARVRLHLADAVEHGARVETGGEWEQNRCRPTVLTGVTADAIVHSGETFGPVTAVYPVESADEAIEKANQSPYGLSAAVYTRDLQQAMRFANELKAGMVHVNGTTIQEESQVPFGGVGDSGMGRESTDADLSETTEWKWITIAQP